MVDGVDGAEGFLGAEGVCRGGRRGGGGVGSGGGCGGGVDGSGGERAEFAEESFGTPFRHFWRFELVQENEVEVIVLLAFCLWG